VPVLAAARWAGRTVHLGAAACQKARTGALTLAAFACWTAAAWWISVPLGLLVAGAVLLALELLTSADQALTASNRKETP
jgi:hypothetical protein